MITSVQLFTLALFLLLPLASARAQDALLEGTGKNAVQTYCVQCHDLSTVTRSGYNGEGWRNNLHMMINVGSTLPQSEVEPLVQYLAKNFPARLIGAGSSARTMILPARLRISAESTMTWRKAPRAF